MRRAGNDKGARCDNIWATTVNAPGTISDIVIIILKFIQ